MTETIPLGLLTSRFTRQVMQCIYSRAKSLQTISVELSIPVRRLAQELKRLEKMGLVTRVQTVKTRKGKKVSFFTSRTPGKYLDFETLELEDI